MQQIQLRGAMFRIRAAKWGIGVLFVLAVLMAAPPPFTPARPAAAATLTIFSEDFEGPFPGAWTVYDEYPASGADYWGVNSTLTAHGGQDSVWCAEVGTSQTTGNPNSQDGVYDNDMKALMKLQTPDLSGYASVAVTFWYWAWNSMGPGANFSVQVSHDGTTYTALWGIGQGQGTGSNWEQVTVPIPLDTRYVAFLFLTDGGVQSIGAYVDDVALTGADSTPPTISHAPITSAVAGDPVFVTADVTDNVAVASAVLYYQSVGQSAFASLPMTGTGATYTATIPAQASAGTVRYYIEATDTGGNVARAPTGGSGSPYSVTVSGPQTPSLLVALIAIVVLAVVGIAAALVLRRRKARAPPVAGSPTYAPPSVAGPEGPSPPAAPMAPPSPPPAPPVPPAVAPSMTPTPPATGVCPACGLENLSTAVFCNRCGTRVR